MSTHPRYDEAMKSSHWTPERCAKAFEIELHNQERDNAELRDKLAKAREALDQLLAWADTMAVAHKHPFLNNNAIDIARAALAAKENSK